LAGDGWLIREERWVADHHLEHDHSDAPPVYCFIVSLLPEDLRSDVVRSANCGKGKTTRPLVTESLIKDSFELIEIR